MFVKNFNDDIKQSTPNLVIPKMAQLTESIALENFNESAVGNQSKEHLISSIFDLNIIITET